MSQNLESVIQKIIAANPKQNPIFQTGTTSFAGHNKIIQVVVGNKRVNALAWNISKPGQVTVFWDEKNKRYVAWEGESSAGSGRRTTTLAYRKTRPQGGILVPYHFVVAQDGGLLEGFTKDKNLSLSGYEVVGVTNKGDDYITVFSIGSNYAYYNTTTLTEVTNPYLDASFYYSSFGLYSEVSLRSAGRWRSGDFTNLVGISLSLIKPIIAAPEGYYLPSTSGNRSLNWDYKFSDNTNVGSATMSSYRSDNIDTYTFGTVFEYTINYSANYKPGVYTHLGNNLGFDRNSYIRNVTNQTQVEKTISNNENLEVSTISIDFNGSDNYTVSDLFYSHNTTPSLYNSFENGVEQTIITRIPKFNIRYDFSYTYTLNFTTWANPDGGYDLKTVTSTISNTQVGFIYRPSDWQYTISSYGTPESTRQASSGGGLKYTGTGTNWDIIEENGNIIPLFRSPYFTSSVDIVFYSYGFGDQIVPLGTWPAEITGVSLNFVPVPEDKVYIGYSSEPTVNTTTRNNETVTKESKLYIGDNTNSIYAYFKTHYKETITTDTTTRYYYELYNVPNLCIKINNNLFTIEDFTSQNGVDYSTRFFFQSNLTNKTTWDLVNENGVVTHGVGITEGFVETSTQSTLSYWRLDPETKNYYSVSRSFPNTVDIYETVNGKTTKKIGGITPGEIVDGEYTSVTLSPLDETVENVNFYLWNNVYPSGTFVTPDDNHTTSLIRYLSDKDNCKTANLYTTKDENGGDVLELAISQLPTTTTKQNKHYADIYRFNTTSLKWERRPNAVSPLSKLSTIPEHISYHPKPINKKKTS